MHVTHGFTQNENVAPQLLTFDVLLSIITEATPHTNPPAAALTHWQEWVDLWACPPHHTLVSHQNESLVRGRGRL